jgi:hypothetical protein
MAQRITAGRVGADVASVINEHADLIEKLLELVAPLQAAEYTAEADAAEEPAEPTEDDAKGDDTTETAEEPEKPAEAAKPAAAKRSTGVRVKTAT